MQNPSYYNLEGVDETTVATYLSDLIQSNLQALEDAGCLSISSEDGSIESLTPGRIASFYYLQHATMATFRQELRAGMGVPDVLHTLCAAAEYDELPVRHNEDKLNGVMSGEVRYAPDLKTVGE